ncbi:hypothetical protein HMN09_00396200 [Mycena chlorophos]|uniref:Uncharacterized protein n=1 Tax=Mycena chlorophos TaxID=658473 RepID=A0A8H6WH54_MYCCL|nr:hypothetical protein HMN09_00396200 [Mycena chlorophos]
MALATAPVHPSLLPSTQTVPQTSRTPAIVSPRPDPPATAPFSAEDDVDALIRALDELERRGGFAALNNGLSRFMGNTSDYGRWDEDDGTPGVPMTPTATACEPSVQTTRPPTPPISPSTQPRAPIVLPAPLPATQPKKRRTAASLPAPQPRAAPLRITTQLNADWQGSEGGPDIYGAMPATEPTTRTRKTHKRRDFVNPRLHRRFLAVCWTDPEKPPKAMTIDDCATWPEWTIKQGEKFLPPILLENERVEVYSQEHHYWASMSIDSPFALATNCVVFLRPVGFEWDEVAVAEKAQQFLPPPKPHQRYNLQRRVLRDEYRNLLSPATSSSRLVADRDSDTESAQSPQKRTQTDAELDLPTPTRPRLSIDTTMSRMSLPPPESPSPDSTEPSSLVSPVDIEMLSTEPPAPWPTAWYYCDVVAGFVAMDTVELKGLTTYGDNRRKWNNAPEALRQEFSKAGRTAGGLWSAFSRRIAAAKKNK